VTKRSWAVFLLIVLAVGAALELFGYFTGTFTLSQSVWAWTGDYWPLALAVCSFVFGALVTHFWWRSGEEK
jgi:hypothetical protein